jgi:1,4-alpha-glucan branching enzyme
MPSGSVSLNEPLVEALLAARMHDPFGLLGLQQTQEGWRLLVFNPRAEAIRLRMPGDVVALKRVHPAGLFEWRGVKPPPSPYALSVTEARNA